MSDKLVFKMQAQDAVIVKEIQHGEVKTQSFVDGKAGYIDRKDIKRLGYSDLKEYVAALEAKGYTQEK